MPAAPALKPGKRNGRSTKHPFTALLRRMMGKVSNGCSKLDLDFLINCFQSIRQTATEYDTVEKISYAINSLKRRKQFHTPRPP